MYASIATTDYVCRNKVRKPFEPEARCLGFPVSELPRLDDLVRLPDAAADDTDRVFDRDSPDRKIHDPPDEPKGLFLLCCLVFEPPCTADGKVCAGRMSDREIKARQILRQAIALDVRPRTLGRKQVERYSFVPATNESAAVDAGEFT